MKFFKKSKHEKINEIVDLRMAEIMTKVDMDFKFLQSMQKLEIKDGDIIVLKYPGVLSETASKALKRAFHDMMNSFGYKIHIIVLEENMDIGVLQKKIEDTLKA